MEVIWLKPISRKNKSQFSSLELFSFLYWLFEHLIEVHFFYVFQELVKTIISEQFNGNCFVTSISKK